MPSLRPLLSSSLPFLRFLAFSPVATCLLLFALIPLQVLISLASMDELSAETILELQIQDLIDLKDNQKGKQRHGLTTDIEYCIQLQLEEAQVASGVLQDRRFCHSVARAINTDAALIAFLNAENLQAYEDRRLAQSLSGQPRRTQNTFQPEWTSPSEEFLSQFSALNVANDGNGKFQPAICLYGT